MEPLDDDDILEHKKRLIVVWGRWSSGGRAWEIILGVIVVLFTAGLVLVAFEVFLK